MSQVSLPMRIALGATLCFCALWFVALKPKPAPDPSPADPAPAAGAQSAPGKAAEAATAAAGSAQQASDAREQAANEGATRPAQAAEKADAGRAPVIDLKKAADGDASKAAMSVLRQVDRGKVAVLLFWDRRLPDDRAVSRAVGSIDRHRGKVSIHRASIRDLSDYESITRGVPVVTSPTVLIIDRAARARAVAGLTVERELDDLVGKALRVKP